LWAELARWPQQGGQLRPEQGHGGEEKRRSLTLAMANGPAVARGAIDQQLPEAPGKQEQVLLALVLVVRSVCLAPLARCWQQLSSLVVEAQQ
jgi:hypothetical protein